MSTGTIPSVNIHEAKTHLSRLIDEIRETGRPIVIAKAGKPQVKMVPLEEHSSLGRFGFLKDHRVPIPEDFDRLHQDEIIALFSGEAS